MINLSQTASRPDVNFSEPCPGAWFEHLSHMCAEMKFIKTKTARLLVSVVVAILMTVTSLASSVAMAQSSVPDTEAPVIELEEIREGIIGQDQVFTALVKDNDKVRDVKLYYRLAGGDRYQSMLMENLASTSYYTASISTTEDDLRNIEYYIQARDEGGNRVVKGFAFDPLVRELVEARSAPVPQPQVATPAGSGGIKVWQVVLGVLAVGALAGLAAGGGGGSDNPPSQQTVPLTLTISPP